MRSVVALVEARPETVCDDYRRALQLAGLDAPAGGGAVTLVRHQGEDFPGFGMPAWQTAGITGAVGAGGRTVTVTAARGTGKRSPAALGRGPLLLLPVPRLEAGWGVRCAVDLACSVAGMRSGAPRSEVRLEELARNLARLRSDHQELGVLADGILWGRGGGTLQKGYLQRNVLLAGRDPVAVDATACRLAGFDPLRVGWLRMCHEQRLGIADPAGIDLKGRGELVGEPFVARALLGTEPAGAWSLAQLRERAWSMWRRPRLLKEYRLSPWGRLEVQYRGGVDSAGRN